MGLIRKKFYNYIAISSLVVLFTFGTHTIQAQLVVDAAGGDANGDGGTVSYSVGQVFYTFIAAPGGMENQGVQQPVDFNALPVTLVNFEVNSVNGQVLVLWQTTAESNNDFFTVERSSNSINFEEVHTVNAPGNSNILRKYSWTDTFPHQGTSYYRLKQTDFDKSFTYSTIKSVSIKSLPSVLEVFPNPVSDYLILKDSGRGGSRSYKIFDMNGRLVETSVLKDGEQKIDLTRLSSAIYLVHFINNTDIQKIKIIKN